MIKWLSLVKNWNVGFSISTNIITIGPLRSDAKFLKCYIVATLRGKAHCWVICVDLKFLFSLLLLTFLYFYSYFHACTFDFSGSLLWMLIDDWQLYERNTSRDLGEIHFFYQSNNQRFYFATFRNKVKGVTASSKVCMCTCRGSQLAIGRWVMVIFDNFVIV